MVSITSLLIPMLVSAVAVFIVSSIIHMVLPFHRSDFKQIPNEDAVLDAMNKAGVGAGDYVFPWAGSMAALKDPKWLEKRMRGPAGFMTVARGGKPSMTGSLIQWFVFSFVVSLFAGYLAGSQLAPGASYLRVFQIVGTAAFMGFSLAQFQNSIWYHRNWGSTLRVVLDGLLYGLVTAGVFGWLWPK